MYPLRTRKFHLFLLIGAAFVIVSALQFQDSGLATSVASAQTVQVSSDKSLLIRDLSVVEDPLRTFNPCAMQGTPMGKWTFGYLMSEIANEPLTGISPVQMTENWMASWLQEVVVNNDGIRPRIQIEEVLIKPWRELSGGRDVPLDLAVAPFRLMAIVNRVDLRNDAVSGGEGAGEGRFIFTAVDLRNNCAALPFTVSFEYLIERTACESIVDWGRQWHDLAQFDLGTESYNSALEQITEQFAASGVDTDRNPNKSALNVLVTNEVALRRPWEMRVFSLVRSGRHAGELLPATTKQTPAVIFNGSERLVEFINANEAALLARDYDVPLTFMDEPFLGAKAQMEPNIFWDGPIGGTPINSPEARHVLSLNTCSGCHSAETGTDFTIIKPTGFGQVAQLAGFMTGIDVVDPSDGVTVRHFNQLATRGQDLEALLNTSCS